METKKEALKPVVVEETPTHLIGLIEWAGFAITLLKSKNAPPNGVFLPTKVARDDVVWWNYKVNHFGYNGLGKLEECDGDLCILLSTKKALDTVIPIADLPNMRQTETGEFTGGGVLKKTIRLKEHFGKKLHLTINWTEREKQMKFALKAIEDEKRKKADATRRAAEEADRRAKEERKEALRKARSDERAEILARPRLHVMTDGGRRHGIPVIDSEWRILPTDTFCVLVESFDKDKRVAGRALSSFITKKKKGGFVEQKNALPVSEKTPAKKGDAPLATRIVVVRGEPEEVIVAENMEHVKVLRDRGMNHGTLVMIPDEKESGNGYWNVFRLKDGDIQSVARLVEKPEHVS